MSEQLRRADDVLPGFEAGRRVERREWGLRWIADTAFAKKGHVDLFEGEEHARTCVGRREYGYGNTEIVSRTVVTYTTRWEAGRG